VVTKVEAGLEEAVDLLVDRIVSGSRIFAFGCGGQMANAMHFAAELSGKFEEYDDPLPCICLGTNPCELTAITNDFGWDVTFERLIQAQVAQGDVVVGFTVSGRGEYYSRAVRASGEKGAYFINVMGANGKRYEEAVNLEGDWFGTPKCQESQLVLLHKICGEAKKKVRASRGGRA
jgi:D-sedoheptulose 7-phosphate isomerase